VVIYRECLDGSCVCWYDVSDSIPFMLLTVSVAVIQEAYPSIPPGSLPSFSELDQPEMRPDTPTSSFAEDIDWEETCSLDEMMSRLDKHLSRVDSLVSQLTHTSSAALNSSR